MVSDYPVINFPLGKQWNQIIFQPTICGRQMLIKATFVKMLVKNTDDGCTHSRYIKSETLGKASGL